MNYDGMTMEDLLRQAYNEARQAADGLADDEIAGLNIWLQLGDDGDSVLRVHRAFVHIAPFYDGAPSWARQALKNAMADSVLARPAFVAPTKEPDHV